MNLPTQIKNPFANWYKGLLRTWASDKLPDKVLHSPVRGFAVPQERNALPISESGIKSLGWSAKAGLVSAEAWLDLRRKQIVLWRVLQIERALARGLLS